MTSWQTIVDSMKESDYHVGIEREGLIGILVPLNDGRSQEVYIVQAGAGEHEVAVLYSAFAAPDADTDYVAILEAVSQIPFGAVAIWSGRLCLRHSVLLDDLEPDAFAVPLRAITLYADGLEQRFVGGDTF